MVSIAQEHWTGVGLERQVQPASSNPVILNGQQLAVWRGESGPVQVWEDRCPHRGMRLSFGFVRGNTLRCIYHGWAYGPDAQCVEIPAHPALTPPKTICANAYPAETRYGIVWTSLAGDGATAPPDLGPDEGWQPVRSIHVASPAEAAIAMLERFDFGQPATVTRLAGNVVRLDFTPSLQLLVAVQPVDAEQAALHVVARGLDDIAGRTAWARKLVRLRAAIEQDREGQDRT